MKWTADFLFDRSVARDSAYNGVFITGVLTTGIYCLPSCPARKPKFQNTRFFRNEEEARRAGLRPCKRCRPDAFYQGRDPDLERLLSLASHVRQKPGDFSGVEALLAETSWGVSKLNLLFRHHFHESPGVFLVRARVDAASRLLLETSKPLLEVAADVGFESASSFHEQFRRRTAMSPGKYRQLRERTSFSLVLPTGFRAEVALHAQGRDAQSRSERVSGREIQKALEIGGQPCLLRVKISKNEAECSVEVAAPRQQARDGKDLAGAHSAALRLLGLGDNPSAFETHLSQTPELNRLVRGRKGLRVPLTSTPYEALLWAIVGQQVNLPFAFTLRRAVIELAGQKAPGGLLAHPSPALVAQLDVPSLIARKFSRSKAEYVLEAARQVASGKLPLDALMEGPATVAEKQLRAVRGIGPWTSQYVLMRGFGFADCLPLGDSALATAVQRFFGLPERPVGDALVKWMEPFSPYRSLATFHLWMSLGGTPA